MSAVEDVRAPSPARRGGPPGAAVLRSLREHAVAWCTLALFVVLAIVSPPFLSAPNLLNILSQQSFVLVIAAAGTLVLIAGGIDISIASVFALGGVVGALAATTGGAVPGVLAGVGVGAAVGLVNGLMTTVGRVNPLIATLATSFVVSGAAVIISGGRVVTVDDPAWRVLGNGGVGLVRWSVVVAVVVVAALWFLLERTVYGRAVFATGGNEEAAWLSGVRVDVVRAVAYVLSGAAAGLGGVIVSSQVGVGQATSGSTLLFTVVAGIVVGGTSIQGGSGSIGRTCVGVLLIALVDNGSTLLGLDPLYQQIVKGVIILVAVAADAWSRRPSSGRR